MPEAATAKPRRAVAIVRVSSLGGRKVEKLLSPDTQLEGCERIAHAHGCEVVRTFEGIGKSASPDDLSKRPGLREAVAMIEAGEADVIVSAYFDRFFRNLTVQAQVLKRIEEAGGEVLAGDAGKISHATAAQWLSATALGMIAEYTSRSMRERTGEALIEYVENGGTPTTPPTGYRSPREGEQGYQLGEHAHLIKPAFERRRDGESYETIAAWLGTQGLQITGTSVGRMLQNRAYLGEYKRGEVLRLGAHEALVDEDLFNAAESKVGAKRAGRSPLLDELLLNGTRSLRCSSCHGHMTGRHVARSGQLLYACQGTGCQHRMAISARPVDAWVSGALAEAVSGYRAGQAGTDLDALIATAAAARGKLKAHLTRLVRMDLDEDEEMIAIGDGLKAAADAADLAVSRARRSDRLAAFDPADLASEPLSVQREFLAALELAWEVMPSDGRKGPGTDVTVRLRRL